MDGWLQAKMRTRITGAGYRSGTTTIFVIYDDRDAEPRHRSDRAPR